MDFTEKDRSIKNSKYLLSSFECQKQELSGKVQA
jgi:hypothetical protein